MKNRPGITPWERPKHINDYPVGPSFNAGHLVEKNESWRTFKPVIDLNSCKGCFICYLVCPDGTIFKKDGKVAFDYDFCKGCGICANECSSKAIRMVKEENE